MVYCLANSRLGSTPASLYDFLYFPSECGLLWLASYTGNTMQVMRLPTSAHSSHHLYSPLHHPLKDSHFSILDFKGAFFSIPLHSQSQNTFAFIYTDQNTNLFTQLSQILLLLGFWDILPIFDQFLASYLFCLFLNPSLYTP